MKKNVPTTSKKEMNNVKMIIERSENSIKDMNASERCCLFFSYWDFRIDSKGYKLHCSITYI